MSKHGEKKRIIAGVAPAGQRLSGPGTRSKNPRRYDANAHLGKAAREQRARDNA